MNTRVLTAHQVHHAKEDKEARAELKKIAAGLKRGGATDLKTPASHDGQRLIYTPRWGRGFFIIDIRRSM